MSSKKSKIDRASLFKMRSIYQMFAPHVRKQKGRLLWAWLCMFGATLAYLAQPWPLKFIFDYVLLPNQQQPLPEWLSAQTPMTLVSYVIVAVLIIALLRGVLGYGQAYLTASAGQKVVGDIRLRLFNHIQNLSHSFHEQQRSGDLLLRLTGDIQLLRDMLINALLMITERLVLVLSVAGIMLFIDWRLALVALAVIPALAIISSRTSGHIKTATRKQRRKESKTANVLAETLAVVPIIQAFNRQSWEQKLFSQQHGASLKAGLRTTRLEANLDRVVEVVLAIGTAGVLWYGVHRVLAKAITPGDLLVFTAYLTTLYKPIRKLSTFTSRLSKSTVCGERLLSILQTEPEITERENAITVGRVSGNLEFNAVSFHYEAGQPVLADINFTVAAGESIALVGPSGSGKSTISKLLLRFYDPVAGAIKIDQHDIRDFSLASLRDQFSILMQNPYLFARSVRENIAYGNAEATEQEIIQAAQAAGAHDFILKLSDGYDSILSEGGANLSAGQKQRIAIARAFLRNAPIIILDEPMTGLDEVTAAQIEVALNKLIAGRTSVLITHDSSAAKRADRVLRLHDGAILGHSETAQSAVLIKEVTAHV